jgi:hypothetical protein
MDNEVILSADINEVKNDDLSDMKLSSELKTIASAVRLRGTSVIGELKISLEYTQRSNCYVGQ